ncbi:MAG: hypothetical protein M3250_07705 [Thermoproteota archaeon]|nr:hypothetical protein [Thermoproteota archaeon]
MSKETSQNFISTQNIPNDATKQKKLTKTAARYVELEQFKDSDYHKGYFCYNCVYFLKPHHCAIVTDEGIDILGHSSNVIAPHGLCSIWMPNEKEIHGTTIGMDVSKSGESAMDVPLTF